MTGQGKHRAEGSGMGIPLQGGMGIVADAIRRYRDDPASMVREQFGVEPDSWQKKVLADFAARDVRVVKIAMSACAGPGKTALMAWCGLNTLLCQGDETRNLRGAALSITSDNLRDNLWAEIHTWWNRSELLQKLLGINAKAVYSRDHAKTWFLSARSFRKDAGGGEQAQALSGLHAPYVLCLIDESGEISPSVSRKADQAMSTVKWGRILQGGNPTVETGMLYEAVGKKAPGWKCVEISADPDDADRTPRVDAKWAQDQIDEHGREDPWVMAYIMGRFPPGGVNKLLSAEDVEVAMDRHVATRDYQDFQKRMGIDAARFGDDPWVIFPRQGRVAFRPVTMRSPRSSEVVARVLMAKDRWGSEVEFFDDTGGYAVGAIDGLVTAGHAPVPVNFSSQKTQDDRFYNARAEMWWRMAEWVKSGGSLPRIPELAKELCAPTYGFKKGKILLEEKDRVKRRVGHSLDYADALALTFYHADVKSSLARAPMRTGSAGGSSWDYDPLETPVDVDYTDEQRDEMLDAGPFAGNR